MRAKSEKKNVTLYLNADVYDKFASFCDKQGYALSRKIELLMENELSNLKEDEQ